MVDEENKKRRLVFLGGLNGSGKTAVTKVMESNPRITVFYGSKMLMEFLGCKSYRELDAMPEKDQITARSRFFNSGLFADCKTEIALIDFHYILLRGNSRFELSVEEDWAHRIDLFLHIVAEPKLMLERILNDKEDSKRKIQKFKSDYGDYEKQINFYQEISLKIGSEMVKKLGRPFRVIENNSTIEETMGRMKNILGLE